MRRLSCAKICWCLVFVFLSVTPHLAAISQADDQEGFQPFEQASADGQNLSALEVFKRRIVPIMNAKNPSSCSECHLSGMDLKQYSRPIQEETVASLRDSGLINVKHPINPDFSSSSAVSRTDPAWSLRRCGSRNMKRSSRG